MLKQLKAQIPIFEWLPLYERKYFHADLMAGLIVFIMLVPQGMAYAMLAGLPPAIGLYAASIPLIIYALFATSRQLAVGPVALVSLLILTGVSGLAETGSEQFVSYVLLLALMIGVIQALLGFLKVGFLVKYISHAVISGFTSAAAIIIALSQINNLFGIRLPSTGQIQQIVIGLYHHLEQIEWTTTLIGAVSILLLILGKKLIPKIPAALIVVLFTTSLVYFLGLHEQGVSIVGTIPQGLPALSMPLINIDVIKALLPIALVISFIAFMESIAIAKTIAHKEKYKVDPNQELKGLGISNIVGSFFQSMPVTGSFSRSAVNYQAGAKTPLASIITGALMMITLLFLTPLFYYLPKATLAAIIIVAVYSLVDFKELKHLFKVKKNDGWIFVVTFSSTLVIGIEPGLIIGIIFSLLLLLKRSASPHVAELGYLEQEDVFRNVRRYPEVVTHPHLIMLRIDASLYFANVQFFEGLIKERIEEKPSTKWVVLDMSAVNDVDTIAIDTMEDWIEHWEGKGVHLVFVGVKGPIRDIMDNAGWKERYKDRYHYLSLKHALKEIGLWREYTHQKEAVESRSMI
jgi:SulP family sulfate permease